MKLMIVGHCRHGKDTVGEILLYSYGLKFISSSMACAETIMMPAFNKKFEEGSGNFKYATVQECYDDRHNHRAFWFDKISEYCKDEPGRLTKLIFATNDVYCGIRSRREFHAVKNERLFDFSIFVDALDRLLPEPASSMQIEPWMCDYVLDNNGDLGDLNRNLNVLMRTLHYEHIRRMNIGF